MVIIILLDLVASGNRPKVGDERRQVCLWVGVPQKKNGMEGGDVLQLASCGYRWMIDHGRPLQ